MVRVMLISKCAVACTRGRARNDSARSSESSARRHGVVGATQGAGAEPGHLPHGRCRGPMG
eukprot:4098047-Karenia_brevis.AAC.1